MLKHFHSGLVEVGTGSVLYTVYRSYLSWSDERISQRTQRSILQSSQENKVYANFSYQVLLNFLIRHSYIFHNVNFLQMHLLQWVLFKRKHYSVALLTFSPLLCLQWQGTYSVTTGTRRRYRPSNHCTYTCLLSTSDAADSLL